MKRRIQKIIVIALMLLVFQIPSMKVWAQSNPTTTGPIGSQLAFGINEDIKYWNGTVWVAISSGLPGQSLQFVNGVPTWVNNPNGITTDSVTNITGTTAFCGGHIASSSGSPITARGVCWSNNHNPTLANSFSIDDSIGKGSFTSQLTGLIPDNTYYAKAYATNSAGTAYGNEVSFNTIILKPVYDIDGNGYDTVVIGTQTWLKRNLNVTHYRNGDAIPNVTDSIAWTQLTTGAYCNYNNDTNNAAIYGRLYNFYTISDPRNLCPTGWHVPTEAEWYVLPGYLGGFDIAGGKLKEAGTSHWSSPNTNATNETGFTALPGGARHSDGSFLSYHFEKNNYGLWWLDFYGIDYFYMEYNSDGNYINDNCGYNTGLSIRCLKD